MPRVWRGGEKPTSGGGGLGFLGVVFADDDGCHEEDGEDDEGVGDGEESRAWVGEYGDE